MKHWQKMLYKNVLLKFGGILINTILKKTPLSVFIILMIVGYCAEKMLEPEGDDLRYELFEKDVAQLSSNVSEDEPLTMIAKKCIESGIYIETREF